MLIVTGVNAEGQREILSIEVATSETRLAGAVAFAIRSRTLGVVLVVSDAHPGLVEAIGVTVPGVTWQRCL
ncbi:Transposase, Mutator family [Ferrithrix thermotolerans DSM 19514]|uniref:Transposase, Mutator family n=1 Tax=Ferrithrix thermotolerans DSM 19514 TaxID=1121881 RepID=A0A1M4X4U9_9ACTN|nr:Transposase, Mutator family [Ferrithrix thermotolerans DSM 19514]